MPELADRMVAPGNQCVSEHRLDAEQRHFLQHLHAARRDQLGVYLGSQLVGPVWVNGINLGRFWDLGPQYTLYMPGCWMKTGQNEIVVLDIEPTGHRRVRGVTEHIWGLKVDKNLKYHRKPDETIGLDRRDMISQGTFQGGDAATEVDFNRTVSARYLCIESLNSHSNDNHASIAEIYLIDPAGQRMDRNAWQIVFADSEELVGEPGNADNIIDEQPVTIWHTQWQNGSPNHPHQVVIDLGNVVAFKGLIYLPRNGSNPGKIKDYRIYGSQAPVGNCSSDTSPIRSVCRNFGHERVW